MKFISVEAKLFHTDGEMDLRTDGHTQTWRR